MPLPELPDSHRNRFQLSRSSRWRRRAVFWSIVSLVVLVLFLFTWHEFFVYVPPGHYLVIIAKDGKPLPPGHVLAEPGQKGIQARVQGEGWHFVLPIVYDRRVEEDLLVAPGEVGIVTAKGGKPLPPGRLLAEPGERGIQRAVLTPGRYRINKYGFDVELVPATEIKSGFVGVVRRLLGTAGAGRFAEKPDERGILRDVLQPGIYYLNTKEYQVLPVEVGIFQTSFRYDKDPRQNTAITFVSTGGLPISMDCTIEWEILPLDMPAVIAEYGDRHAVEAKVIDVQAHAIGRDKGISYGVQDFLEGAKREKFQDDFTSELTRVCGAKNVKIRSAFIRNIVIPENYLKPIRDKQIAAETQLTNKAREATAQSEADVEREMQMVAQKVAAVEAETLRIVAGIDRQVANIKTQTENEVEKMKAQYGAQIAQLEAQRVTRLGEAEAGVKKLRETAKSSLYRMKMDVFGNNSDAFLRYSMAQDLNPRIIVRLFHAGPGTFWTNLDNKNMTLMLPAASPPGSADAGQAADDPTTKQH
jgi:hypothetical protein